jgi:NADH-quinone oxidoreductase subunit N
MIPLPSFSPEVWTLLAPLLVVCGAGLAVLVLDLLLGDRWPAGGFAVVALVAAAAASLSRWGRPLPAAEAFFGGALRVDDFAVFLEVAVLLASALALATVDGYLSRAGRGQRGEFHALALFSITGMLLLVSAGELLTLFLGLELLSFPTYALCAFRREDMKSNESALKYFVLGSFASSIFLYGIALLWGSTGTTNLRAIGAAPEDALLQLGILLVAVGFLFKIGAAPFHMWVPDVYEGAPTPVTAFMATAVKLAAVGAFVRLVVGTLVSETMPLPRIVWWLAVLTMTVGNISALTQDNAKRMLAFSSVAHAGYMLVGLAAVMSSGWDGGAVAILYYLLAYVFLNVGAFTVVALLSRRAEGDLNFDRDWSGAARRHPFLGVAMVIFMLGLGGVPPTSGFFGKYSLFKAAIDAGLTSLVVIAVLNSLVSVYYYLRVVVSLTMRPARPVVPGVLESLASGRTQLFAGPGAMAAEEPLPAPAPRWAEEEPLAPRLVVGICLVATLWLGLGPAIGGLPGIESVLGWAAAAVESLH